MESQEAIVAKRQSHHNSACFALITYNMPMKNVESKQMEGQDTLKRIFW